MSGQPERALSDGWATAVPELCIAVIVIACAAVTGYAAAGLAGTALVMTVAAVTALAVLRVIGRGESARPDGSPQAGSDFEAIPGTFTGYWRRRSGLTDATQSLSAYDTGLRITLQHLLAARLAEHHGVSLQDEPAAARRLLCPRPGDESLWYWIDPARPPAPAGSYRGIPPRTLARLIGRLERI